MLQRIRGKPNTFFVPRVTAAGSAETLVVRVGRAPLLPHRLKPDVPSLSEIGGRFHVRISVGVIDRALILLKTSKNKNVPIPGKKRPLWEPLHTDEYEKAAASTF